jgi:hypothetical protein
MSLMTALAKDTVIIIYKKETMGTLVVAGYEAPFKAEEIRLILILNTC